MFTWVWQFLGSFGSPELALADPGKGPSTHYTYSSYPPWPVMMPIDFICLRPRFVGLTQEYDVARRRLFCVAAAASTRKTRTPFPVFLQWLRPLLVQPDDNLVFIGCPPSSCFVRSQQQSKFGSGTPSRIPYLNTTHQITLPLLPPPHIYACRCS